MPKYTEFFMAPYFLPVYLFKVDIPSRRYNLPHVHEDHRRYDISPLKNYRRSESLKMACFLTG